MKILKLLLLMSFSAVASAIDCTHLNLLLKENSPLLSMKVYDQGKLNICYAYSASQLTNFYLIHKGERSLVHPAWTALHYSRSRTRDRLEIGHVLESIEEIRKEGICEYQEVEKGLRKLAGDDMTGIESLLLKLERTLSSPVKKLEELLQDTCAPSLRKSISLPKVVRYNYQQLPDDQSFLKAMGEKLIRWERPVSIAYCANVWKNPRYVGIGLTFTGKRDRVEKDCEYHESLLIGQKEIQGQCHYLVRNTWGDRWNKASSPHRCTCRHRLTGQINEECTMDSHPGDDYELLGCWLPAGHLSRNTGLLTVMEGEPLEIAGKSSESESH